MYISVKIVIVSKAFVLFLNNLNEISVLIYKQKVAYINQLLFPIDSQPVNDSRIVFIEYFSPMK